MAFLQDFESMKPLGFQSSNDGIESFGWNVCSSMIIQSWNFHWRTPSSSWEFRYDKRVFRNWWFAFQAHVPQSPAWSRHRLILEASGQSMTQTTLPVQHSRARKRKGENPQSQNIYVDVSMVSDSTLVRVKGNPTHSGDVLKILKVWNGQNSGFPFPGL